jgi:glycosyltransferase involved in cell wall biosynthesis
LRDHPLHSPLVDYTRQIEEKLIDAADLVVGCSDSDAEYFASRGKESVVVPNAAALPPRRPAAEGDANAPHRVGFLGSGHPPNVKAAQFILLALAPRFPQVSFEFVGGVCEALSGLAMPANAVLHGVVDGARKSEILFGWSVALDPVEEGGGSSLKLPDYMAHALPVISTPFGARGFPLAEKRAGIIAERGEFASRLRDLLAKPRLCREIGESAQGYATGSLGWPSAIAPYRKAIERLPRHRPAAAAARPALLVVTYRYTEPPPGGAETYLIEVVRRLRARCRTIDLAAIDLGALVNRHHFAAEYSPEGAGASRVLAECFDTVHLFEPEPAPGDLIERCRRLERAWSREERELYRPFAEILAADGTPSLFAGFYPPENHGGVTRRATAPAFSLLLPPGSRVVRIAGWTPIRKQLRISAIALSAAEPAASPEYRQVIDGEFSCRVLLMPEAAAGFALLDCRTDAHIVANDHREFGVYIEEASVLIEAADAGARDLPARPLAEAAVDLERDNDAVLRAGSVAQWIDALIRQALSRYPEEEAEFALVRGPHSRAMQAWLARHAARYDAVLVQGVPFAVVPETLETLSALDPRPRILTLPHFHADDRFYYWRQYLDAFARADANLLFSEAAAERLKRHGNFAVIPGGGVALEEQAQPADIAQFRALYRSAAPFYLVLGRVTQSKRSDRVLRAYAELRAGGARFELVLIGPYEDGPEPRGDGVRYLGAQPRGIVLAALSECLGLVTMSDSESFGIMICEAWKFKKPVIANAACLAFRELLRHGETGLLVAGDNQLKAAMTALAGTPELAARLGEAGFGTAASRFTWRHVADALADMLFPAAAAMPDAAVGFRPDIAAAAENVAD